VTSDGSARRPVVWLDVVGLTPRLLSHAPRLSALAARGSSAPLAGVFPAVTCTAQATALTGLPPEGHGIVGNGWYWRDTGEVRFWLQSNALIRGKTVYAARKARDPSFTCAKLFWWFNQGAPVEWSVTPKPWYGCDGSKAFGIAGSPPDLAPMLERELGSFPFHAFWGPRAGLPATEWIAAAAAKVLRDRRPSLTLVYLPHLDYDLQRHGPADPRVPTWVAEADRCAGKVLDAAEEVGAEVHAFSEYGIGAVSRAVLPNRALREAGLLAVRDGPFGETLDTFASRAFAVCDHQVAHVHVRDPADLSRVRALLEALPGVDRADAPPAGSRWGDLVLSSSRDAWFAYPYWLDDDRAPDFARTVDIHRKPGYDPLELFLDPEIRFPRLRVASRLAKKALGFRYRMDVVPLDTSLVKGSHGLHPSDPLDGPLLVSSDPSAASRIRSLADLAASSSE
jgi:predicted AlkP superfamily pyrophosphatase or phosphodiesterase